MNGLFLVVLFILMAACMGSLVAGALWILKSIFGYLPQNKHPWMLKVYKSCQVVIIASPFLYFIFVAFMNVGAELLEPLLLCGALLLFVHIVYTFGSYFLKDILGSTPGRKRHWTVELGLGNPRRLFRFSLKQLFVYISIFVLLLGFVIHPLYHDTPDSNPLGGVLIVIMITSMGFMIYQTAHDLFSRRKKRFSEDSTEWEKATFAKHQNNQLAEDNKAASTLSPLQQSKDK